MKRSSKAVRSPIRNEVLNESLLLLCLSDEFQQDVLSVRRSACIPENGLPCDSSEESMRANQAFSKEVNDRTDQYLLSPPVVNRTQKLKIDYAKGVITHEEYDMHLRQIESKAPLNALRYGVSELLSKYHLPNSLRGAIEYYLLYNRVTGVGRNYTIGTTGDNGEPRDVYIRINGPMTALERRQAMEEAAGLFSEMYPQFTMRINKRSSIERDVKLLQAWKDRNRLNLPTSKSIGEYLWDEDENTTDEQLARSSARGAMRFRQSLRRLKAEFRRRFGRELV